MTKIRHKSLPDPNVSLANVRKRASLCDMCSDVAAQEQACQETLASSTGKESSARRLLLASLPAFLHYLRLTTWREPHDRLQCSEIPGETWARQGISRCPQEDCHRLAGS